MIKIAANYSRNLLKLLDEQRVEVDYIKLSRNDDLEADVKMIKRYRPGLIHCLPNLGRPDDFWQQYDFERIKRLAAEAQVPYLSIHFDAYESELGAVSQEQLQAQLVRNWLLIREKIDMELLVENTDFQVYDSYEGVCDGEGRLLAVIEPQFFNQFLQQTRAKMLLDTAHIRCAAQYFHLDAKDYMRQFELATVREIHLSGPREAGGTLRDVHWSMREPDYQLFEQALLLTGGVKVVTLEFGGIGGQFETAEKNDITEMEYQLKRIKEIVQLESRHESS